MIEAFGVHRMDHAQIVHVNRNVRKQFARPQATLPVLLPAKGRAHQFAQLAAGHFLGLRYTAGNVAAVVLLQLRLVIERIDVARPAHHEQEDHPLGSWSEMWHAGRQRMCRCGGFRGSLFGAQAGQC